MNQAIEAVVFDLGGVLIDVDVAGAIRWLSERQCSVTDPAEFAAVSGIHAHERGELPGIAFYERINTLLALPASMDELHAWWTGMFSCNDDMFALAHEVASVCPVFILSNTGPVHWQQACEQFDLDAIARDSLTSFEAGVAKPDPEIFALAEQRFEIEPATTAFVDDLADNASAAAAAGWQAIHHERYETTRNRLLALGVAITPGRSAGCP